MRRRTSRKRHHTYHVKALKAEVMSARIAWHGFTRFFCKSLKLAALVGIVCLIGYGLKQAVEHTFHQNPDFRLRAIVLEENNVFDEPALVDFLEIDLSSNIFDFDTKALRAKLIAAPAIIDASVERELPGTLSFRLETREPIAWIAESGEEINRELGGRLVDELGLVYPCPEGQLSTADSLPFIIITPGEEPEIDYSQKLVHSDYRLAARLLAKYRTAFPNRIGEIESISREKSWSLTLQTRSGTFATFGLDEHRRQLNYFMRALQHAESKKYQIATINLIPKRNVPITVLGESNPPKAIPISEVDLSTASSNPEPHH